jgi:hypothetical protein
VARRLLTGKLQRSSCKARMQERLPDALLLLLLRLLLSLLVHVHM